MPERGSSARAEAGNTYCQAIVLFASGYTSDVTILHGLIEHSAAFAHKPFTLNSLGQKVREVLDAR